MYHEAQPTIKTSVNVSPEFYRLCKQHKIKFSEAMRTGIGVILAEKGVVDYDTDLNLFRRMNVFKKKAEEALNKIAELEEEFKIKKEEKE